jgi:hypothetical protein
MASSMSGTSHFASAASSRSTVFRSRVEEGQISGLIGPIAGGCLQGSLRERSPRERIPVLRN